MGVKVTDINEQIHNLPDPEEIGKFVNKKVAQEEQRATEAETVLAQAIGTETERAEQAEQVLQHNIGAEEARAMTAEVELGEALRQEHLRALGAEKDIRTDLIATEEKIDNVLTTSVEQLENALQEEATRAQQAESFINSKLEDEIEIRDDQTHKLDTAIVNEVNRAKKAEKVIEDTLDNEIQRATSAEQTLNTSLQSEISRATTAETQLSNSLQDEVQRSTQVDLEADTRITTIEEKIPNQATKENQLADKDFVNSSINVSAAFFRGNFQTKADLDAWQDANLTVATNNDYAYVNADETHSGEAWRYLYRQTDPQIEGIWEPQFRVNEAPFTDAQLKAINSEMTKQLTDKLIGVADQATRVSFTASHTNGLEIGEITINGVTTKLYAEPSGAGKITINQGGQKKGEFTVDQKEDLTINLEANVQADWLEENDNDPAFIRNKPADIVRDDNYVHTDNNFTDEEKESLAGKVNKSGDTMTGAFNFADGVENLVGDDVSIGSFNVGGLFGIKGKNGVTGIGLIPTTDSNWISANHGKITYDGLNFYFNKSIITLGQFYENGKRVYSPDNPQTICAFADVPTGFQARITQANWGNQIGTLVTSWSAAHASDVQWRYDNPKEGQLSMLIDGTVYVNEGQDEVYHAGHKPTANDIGAVNKAGDTMTGPLYVQDIFGETARVVTTLDRMPYANIQFRTAVGIHYHPICTFEKSISEGDNSAGITIMGQIGGWEAYRKDNVHYTIGNRAEPTITGFHSNDLGSDKYHFELYQNASDANRYDLYLVCGDWVTVDIIVFGHYITLNNPYITVSRPTTEQITLKDDSVLITKQPKITLLSLIPDKTNLSRANLTVKVENVPESLWSHLRAEVCVFRRHDVKSRINGQKVQRVRYRWQRINKHEDIQQKGDIFIFKNQYFDARRHGGQGKFCIRLRYLLYQNINEVVRQYGAITFAQENFSVAYTKVQQDLQKPRIR